MPGIRRLSRPIPSREWNLQLEKKGTSYCEWERRKPKGERGQKKKKGKKLEKSLEKEKLLSSRTFPNGIDFSFSKRGRRVASFPILDRTKSSENTAMEGRHNSSLIKHGWSAKKILPFASVFHVYICVYTEGERSGLLSRLLSGLGIDTGLLTARFAMQRLCAAVVDWKACHGTVWRAHVVRKSPPPLPCRDYPLGASIDREEKFRIFLTLDFCMLELEIYIYICIIRNGNWRLQFKRRTNDPNPIVSDRTIFSYK